MQFNLKRYKFKKIQYFFKNQNIFFLYNSTNLNFKNWIKIEQNLSKQNLKYFKIYNTLIKTFLKNSIFFNLTPLINGSVIIIYTSKETNINLQKIINLNPLFTFLCLKFNNSIYSSYQIRTIYAVNYKQNIKILNQSLKKILKYPYYKLNKKSK